jgi:hypothetical protein
MSVLRGASAVLVLAGSVALVARSQAHTTTPSPARSQEPERTAWPPLATAATFFLSELREKTRGNWSAAWRTLYPLHQDVASRMEFVTCERLLPFSAPLQALHVVGIRKVLVRVPGSSRRVRGVAVNVHVELSWYGPRDPIVFHHTFHLVPMHGHWTWLLSPSRYRLYHDRGCIPALAE